MTTKIVRNNKKAKDLTPKDEILTQFDNPKVQFEALDGDFPAWLFPPAGDACRLVMTCAKGDYSASKVAHAVEDCDAHLLNLNVTADETPEGEMVVVLRVGINNGESVARSLARYGYDVVKIVHESQVDGDTMRRRIEELMRYIEM